MLPSTVTLKNLPQKNCKKTVLAKSTSSQVASPAKMCHAPALEKALKTAMGKLLAVDCGESTQGSLAKLDHDGSWLKMSDGCCQQVLISDREETSELFSGTWSTWGIMRSGRVTVLKPLARRTKEKECSLWRTPDANLGARGPKSAEMYEECKKTNKHALNLLDQVKHECNWPTPRANKVSGPSEKGFGLNLMEAVDKVQNWPTPTVADTFTGKLKSTQQKPGSMHSVNLSQCVNWPTPTECGNYNRKGASATSGDGLATAVRMYPTPTANDYKGAGPTTKYTNGKGKVCDRTNMRLDYAIYATNPKGQLNADWVEILMGLPIGWTDIDCEEPQPWPGWPAPMNAGMWRTPMDGNPTKNGRNEPNLPEQAKIAESGQYPYEPPRVVVGQKNRAKRLKCLGNGCCPAQIYPIFAAIAEVENE